MLLALNLIALTICRKLPARRIFAEDAAPLKRMGRTVHLLYSFHALEHMPDPVSFLSPFVSVYDRTPCAFYAQRLQFLHTERLHDHIWFAYPDHLHMYSPRSLLWLAEKAGYEVLEVVSDCVLDDEEEQFEGCSRLQPQIRSRSCSVAVWPKRALWVQNSISF